MINVPQMKLATKLGSAFAAVIVLTVLLGVFAIVQLGRLHANTADIATSWLPSVELLGKVQASMNDIRRAEADHLFSFDDKAMDMVDARLATVKKALAEQLTAYEKVITSPEEQRGYDEFKRNRDRYFGTQPKLLELSRGGDKTFEEGKQWFNADSKASFDRMLADLQVLIDINSKGSAVAAQDAEDTYATARVWIVGALLLVCVVGAVLALLIVRSIVRQLGAEPGDATELAQQVASGNLAARIVLRPGDSSSLMASLGRMRDGLSEVVANVRSNAESVATASDQISQGNFSLSQRTEEQASSIQQTAATMDELSSTVRNNADNAKQANQLALGASTVAIEGGQVVGQVVQTMKGINDSSKKIADIISVIDGIAFQTNILALNAAVEAARAGEQGRGFAVVAGEVRSLAQRSAEAAKEIKTLITNSVEQVEQGTGLVDKAGKTMEEIVTAIRRVSDIVAEISSASAEQSDGVSQVGQAISQLDQATQQNAALVEESAAASASLKQQAQQMVGAVSIFKLRG